MSMSELRERLAAGWTFQEAVMGKDWQEKYSNIARQRCVFGFSGSCGSYRVWLQTTCNLGSPEFHGVTYILHEMEIVSWRQDIYAAIDRVIEKWFEQHGSEIARLQGLWNEETMWRNRYPDFANWIQKGKRCCVDIKINRIAQQTSARVWHYDKPTNTEIVLFERKNQSTPENELLFTIDQAIQKWLDEHPDFEYSI